MYTALALQTTCHAVNHCASAADARASIKQSIAIIAEQAYSSKLFIGPDVKLIVLPEYFCHWFSFRRIDQEVASVRVL